MEMKVVDSHRSAVSLMLSAMLFALCILRERSSRKKYRG
jgi:hypothetical protein